MLGDYSYLISQAANVVAAGDNPAYTWTDFIAFYPQFGKQTQTITNPDGTTSTVEVDRIPLPVQELFLTIANNTVLEKRWHSLWKLGMSLFLAHNCQLYIQTSAPVDALIGEIKSLGKAQGLASSKSVGGVSVSYDFNSIIGAFNRWGTLNLTIYGQQFVNHARFIGRGGMYIW